uniref:AAA+ ATPase domain-containing protein n=1 Tax=Panagrolaimus sp. PS1159 TaxID=55785 RepID=A0AC35G346_9BILA
MFRSNNPQKRRQNDDDPFGFEVDDDNGGEGRKKSSKAVTKKPSIDDEIEILSDSSPELFLKRRPQANNGHSSTSKNKKDSSEILPKKLRLSPISAENASTESSFLASAKRNNSSLLKSKSNGSTNEKENTPKSTSETAPKKLTTKIASIFNPSEKPSTLLKPEKNYNKAELASKYAAKKQAERDARYGSTPSAKHMDLQNTTYEGFRMANGSKEIIKEMKSITPHATKKPDNPQLRSQPSSSSDHQHEQQQQPPARTKDPNNLLNHESLKHFEQHIIEHILSEILVTNVNVTWDAVAGLEQAKNTLREIVVFPFLRPDLFKGLRAPSKGVLLFGPPGTGKTLIARCVANQAKATFFNVSVSTVMSKWVGEGEKVVRALFEIARLKLPSIIFIDEIDALLSARKDGDHESSRRVKTEFLIQMDGIATNSDERLLVLEADYEKLAELTNGFSGADMFHFAKEAAYGPLRDVINDIEKIPEEKIRPIKFKDFTNVLSTVKPTVLKSELDSYLEWDKNFGCHSTHSS